MEIAPSKPQVTSLLSNDVLTRVERLRLNAVPRFTNRSQGEHLSGRGGSSIEFRDYRAYVPGDDMRFVDWNIFSRLHRPYLKLFHEEEQMHLVLLVDASSSMRFEDKLQRAKQLGAAFGAMGLLGSERVSVQVFNQRGGQTTRLRPHVGRGSMRQLFRFLEKIEGEGDGPLEEGIEVMLRHHRGRGVAVVLSDFLTTGNLRRALNRLFFAGLEIFGVQILGPTEIDPEVTGDLRLVDSETATTLDITAAGDLATLYQEYRMAYQHQLEALCQQRSGRLITINTKDSLEHVLFDLLRRQGWVR